MAMDPTNLIGTLRGVLAPGMPVDPTVDQLIARQPGRPSLTPAPAPNPRRAANPNLQRVLTVLGRAMSGVSPSPPAAPEGAAADQGTRQPADTAAPAGEQPKVADQRTIDIHRANVMRLAELIGGNLTPHESRRVNEVSAQKLLRLGREAREHELMDAAEDLIREFNAAADTPPAAPVKSRSRT